MWLSLSTKNRCHAEVRYKKKEDGSHKTYLVLYVNEVLSS